jgi:hypothetical protein
VSAISTKAPGATGRQKPTAVRACRRFLVEHAPELRERLLRNSFDLERE